MRSKKKVLVTWFLMYALCIFTSLDLRVMNIHAEEETAEQELALEQPTRLVKKGTGSTGTAIITSNDLQGAMEFVKITTKDGQMFYLVIDYTKDEDNVYFLDTVSVNDLFRIAESSTDANGDPIYIDYSKSMDIVDESKGENQGQADIVTKTEGENQTKVQGKQDETKSPSSEAKGESKKTGNNIMQNIVLLLGIVIIGGAAFLVLYFVKIKNKKIDEDQDNFEDMIDDEEEDSDNGIFENGSIQQISDNSNIIEDGQDKEDYTDTIEENSFADDEEDDSDF